MIGDVFLRVPAFAGQVDPPDERNAVVHDDHLLVMRGSRRMLSVHGKVKTLTGSPSRIVYGRPLAIQREDHREVPGEHMDMQFPALLEHMQDKIDQGRRPVVTGISPNHPDSAVDVPAQDKDGPVCFSDGVAHGLEIGIAVDQERTAIRSYHPPAIYCRYEHSVFPVRSDIFPRHVTPRPVPKDLRTAVRRPGTGPLLSSPSASTFQVRGGFGRFRHCLPPCLRAS